MKRKKPSFNEELLRLPHLQRPAGGRPARGAARDREAQVERHVRRDALRPRDEARIGHRAGQREHTPGPGSTQTAGAARRVPRSSRRAADRRAHPFCPPSFPRHQRRPRAPMRKSQPCRPSGRWVGRSWMTSTTSKRRMKRQAMELANRRPGRQPNQPLGRGQRPNRRPSQPADVGAPEDGPETGGTAVIRAEPPPDGAQARNPARSGPASRAKASPDSRPRGRGVRSGDRRVVVARLSESSLNSRLGESSYDFSSSFIIFSAARAVNLLPSSRAGFVDFAVASSPSDSHPEPSCAVAFCRHAVHQRVAVVHGPADGRQDGAAAIGRQPGGLECLHGLLPGPSLARLPLCPLRRGQVRAEEAMADSSGRAWPADRRLPPGGDVRHAT